MLDDNNAAKLMQGVKGLEMMTRFALAVLALASGVYTYLGVKSLLDGDAAEVFFAAVIYSSAVSVGIYAFWIYLMRFLPLMRDGVRRLALVAVMALGSIMIVAMSSWLNAAALAGSAALEQHLAVTLEGYAADLDQAHSNALSAQSLLPDIRRASVRFSRLADDERETGALTGTSGAGSVVQLLTQMSAQMDELGTTIVASRGRVADLFAEGSGRLSSMRTLVSAPGEVQPRADQFAAEAVALTGVVAALEETSIASSVKRAADDLSLGFIAPVADGFSPDLVERQDQIMETVRASVAAQSAALATAAQSILEQPRVSPRRFVPLSTAEAVWRYASDFAPSWAGAISIDLLPMVLVFVLSVVHSASRREAGALADADRITAGEMMRSVALYREMAAASGDPTEAMDEMLAKPPPGTAPEVALKAKEPATGDAKVTPLDPAKRAKPK